MVDNDVVVVVALGHTLLIAPPETFTSPTQVP